MVEAGQAAWASTVAPYHAIDEVVGFRPDRRAGLPSGGLPPGRRHLPVPDRALALRGRAGPARGPLPGWASTTDEVLSATAPRTPRQGPGRQGPGRRARCPTAGVDRRRRLEPPGRGPRRHAGTRLHLGGGRSHRDRCRLAVPRRRGDQGRDHPPPRRPPAERAHGRHHQPPEEGDDAQPAPPESRRSGQTGGRGVGCRHRELPPRRDGRPRPRLSGTSGQVKERHHHAVELDGGTARTVLPVLPGTPPCSSPCPGWAT